MANLKIAMRRSHGNRRITKMRAAAEKLADAAAKGEPWAIQMVADRFDGKPTERRVTVGPQNEMIQMFRLISVRTNAIPS